MANFNAKLIKIKTGEKSIILNETDAGELMLHIHDRVSIKKDLQQIIAIVDVTDSMVKSGEIGIYEDLLPFFPVSDGDAVELSVATPPPSVAFIRKKMNGGALSKEELHRIVKDTVNHSLSELEIAAFLMAEHYVGMSMDEVEHLTRAIVETGRTIDFGETVVDKHSIGGPGQQGHAAHSSHSRGCRAQDTEDEQSRYNEPIGDRRYHGGSGSGDILAGRAQEDAYGGGRIHRVGAAA